MRHQKEVAIGLVLTVVALFAAVGARTVYDQVTTPTIDPSSCETFHGIEAAGMGYLLGSIPRNEDYHVTVYTNGTTSWCPFGPLQAQSLPSVPPGIPAAVTP